MKATSFLNHKNIRPFFEFFGSVKLAMALLAIIIGACITGTWIESRFDTSVAQFYVYDAPWFIAWLLLLCFNLICAVLARCPWKPRQTGFIITHFGIITILIGAIIGRIWGVEGSMTLFKGDNPSNTIVTFQKNLENKTAASEFSREVHFAFARMQEMEIARILEGHPMGIKAIYQFDPADKNQKYEKGILKLDAGGKHFEFPVIQTLGKNILLKGTPWTLIVLQYFADFRMNGKEPVSVSDKPNNPAVLFEIVGEDARAAFGNRIHKLNFSVVLDKFEVQRDEGTQNPAGFKSHVRFIDPMNKTTVEREIWMNHPAIYPDFPGASLLGATYKFSQASWNPNDLNQTTLQVLFDPGWSFKWIGSLMLCGGLFTMFYLKPYLEPDCEKKS